MRKELITHFIPKAPESEMFRNLRTNIQFMNANKELKTIMVTSTMPGEGKSYVSANLAVVFAQTGKRVVLVDCDMRKGRQFNIFDVSPRPGISNYLSGVVEQDFRGDISDVSNFIQDTDVENLKVISAGNVPPNPSELLISEKMDEFITKLKQICDVVIFDAPPALIVTDAVILARQVDSCLVVTAHSETKMENIQKVKEAIEKVGAKVSGIVVNKMPTSGNRYENMYYYYGSIVAKEDANIFEKYINKIKDFFKKNQVDNIKRNKIKRNHASIHHHNNNVIMAEGPSKNLYDDIKIDLKK